jgi:hypothetical protein
MLRRMLLVLVVIPLAASAANAQVVYLTGTYAQNFDSLATTGNNIPWTNNVTLPGWHSSRSSYDASDGTGNTGSLYSFGVAGTNPVTDRALGSIASGNTGTVLYSLQLFNSSNITFTDITVSFWSEQWRNGGSTTPNINEFAYLVTNDSTGAPLTAAGYTDVNELFFAAPINGGSPGPLDGNLPVNRIFLSHSFSIGTWAPGQFLWLRWSDPNEPGNDNGMAIDEVIFTVVPEPTVIASLGASLLGLWGVRRWRRQQRELAALVEQD